MRIIGEIPHERYKISILKMNEKVTVQFEDRLVSQSYVFRDGSGVSDVHSVQKILTEDFMGRIDARFKAMNKDYVEVLEAIHSEDINDFDII